MLKLALMFYAILAPTAMGVLLALAALTETLASGIGLAAAALTGAGAAWPVSKGAARRLRGDEAA